MIMAFVAIGKNIMVKKIRGFRSLGMVMRFWFKVKGLEFWVLGFGFLVFKGFYNYKF